MNPKHAFVLTHLDSLERNLVFLYFGNFLTFGRGKFQHHARPLVSIKKQEIIEIAINMLYVLLLSLHIYTLYIYIYIHIIHVYIYFHIHS